MLCLHSHSRVQERRCCHSDRTIPYTINAWILPSTEENQAKSLFKWENACNYCVSKTPTWNCTSWVVCSRGQCRAVTSWDVPISANRCLPVICWQPCHVACSERCGGGGKVTRLGRREVIRSGVYSQGNLSGSNWWGLMVESSNAGQRLARKGARKVARLALFSLC